MSNEHVERARESDALFTAVPHQRDVGYGGMADKFPIGALMGKGLSVKTGQTHMQKRLRQLAEIIGEGKVDTTFSISHRLPLEQAPKGYKIFKEQQNEVTKVVLKPD